MQIWHMNHSKLPLKLSPWQPIGRGWKGERVHENPTTHSTFVNGFKRMCIGKIQASCNHSGDTEGRALFRNHKCSMRFCEPGRSS